jgi:hypothetical protein
MTAVNAILLAPNLSYWLAGWTSLVDHSVFGLAFSDLGSDYDDFFLRYPDRFVTTRTEVTAQFRTSSERMLLGVRLLFTNARASDP